MKPPIITPPLSDQTQTTMTIPTTTNSSPLSSTTSTPTPTITTATTTTTASTTSTAQQPPTTISNEVVNSSAINPISSQPTIINTQIIPTTQVQQAPLALTTQPQPQSKTQVTAPPQILNQPPTSINQSQLTPQILQLKAKVQPPQLPINTPSQLTQPIPLATTNTSTGPTALVIIPQHSTTATVIPSQVPKSSSITTKSMPITTTVVTGVPNAHATTLPTITQSAQIQIQTTTTHVPNIVPVPMTAHQQPTTVVTPTIANRPPSTLSVVPITTTTPAIVKAEPTKYMCCLLDNGVRCDRVAGNASFSARIQKIVRTKEMNFILDPDVRHTYICEHHKAIITVAKKSTVARDTKANARNYTANNNTTNITPQLNVNYNEFPVRQQTLQHPVNLEMLANQNRLANNHTGVLNNMPIRPGAQIAYGHYPGQHQNQVGFDSVGGDSIPSSSSGVDVDLQQLQVNTLRRYKRHFRVQTRPGLNKLQLAESLKNHFRTLPIIEKEAITYFVYIVKCYRNKLDHNPKAD